MKKYKSKSGTYYIEQHWINKKFYIYRENKISEEFGTVGELRGGSYKTYAEAEQDLKDLYL